MGRITQPPASAFDSQGEQQACGSIATAWLPYPGAQQRQIVILA
jgi:hypothetical protein